MGILDEIQQRLGLLNTPTNLPSSPVQAPFSLAGTMTPDVSAMTPETFANPLVKSMMGGLASLPQRAIQSAANYQQTGNYDPAPIVEAAMLPMGTGAIAGVPLRANEMVLGAGAVRGRLPNFNAGERLFTPEETAERIWQSNAGKLKKSLSELDRMRLMPDRTGHTIEELDQMGAMLREKAKKPFVSDAEADRLAELALDREDNMLGATGKQ